MTKTTNPDTNTPTRRLFLRSGMWALASAVPALAAARGLYARSGMPAVSPGDAPASSPAGPVGSLESLIDFRYAPRSGQACFSFPDDPHKSLLGEKGDLRCGHPGQGYGINYFPLVISFSLSGMGDDEVVSQELESPGVPIIYTRIARDEAFLTQTVFASNREGEGRVDNVILEITPRSAHEIHAVPVMKVMTRREMALKNFDGHSALYYADGGESPVAVIDSPHCRPTGGSYWFIAALGEGKAEAGKPLRFFIRMPLEGQDREKLAKGLTEADALLDEARGYWRSWRPFGGAVEWSAPGRYNEFLIACTRNILQAREVKDGRTTFNVGPTVYRGLWVVDGNFLLEAARYLGYNREAQLGLEATWAKQEESGAIFAGGGRYHFKDTAIAMFTLVRQAELSGDWEYFHRMKPNVLRGVEFLKSLRLRAKEEGGAPARYGILARAMGDGGLGGIRPEFTNTIWVLAGLKAVSETAARMGFAGYESVAEFYEELRHAFDEAAREEMREHPDGFEFLPMLMKEDPDWRHPDPWKRPRPQVAQWALSHVIYPGLLFEREHPVVRGHIALMQACTQEDVPAETGWLPHEGVWNYNAAFVAHVYLWAGLTGWARRTFHGFLNHATPLYAWREEQPLKGSVYSQYVGDMPHNWASAECILYLRHMLALEDGQALRLMPGIGDVELAAGEGYTLRNSPTRFGGVSMTLERDSLGKEWRLLFRRSSGPPPEKVYVPEYPGNRLRFERCLGAAAVRENGQIALDPHSASWAAFWSGRK